MNTHTAALLPNELFQPAVQMWETAVRAGLRIQEESTRQLGEVLARFGSLEQLRKQAEMVFAEAIHTAQQNLETAIHAINESTRRNLDLSQKALGVSQTESAAQGQPVAGQVWEAALNIIQANTQDIVQANARVLESWTELGRKWSETMAQRSP